MKRGSKKLFKTEKKMSLRTFLEEHAGGAAPGDLADEEEEEEEEEDSITPAPGGMSGKSGSSVELPDNDDGLVSSTAPKWWEREEEKEEEGEGKGKGKGGTYLRSAHYNRPCNLVASI